MALKYGDDLTIVENTFRNKSSTIQNNLKDFDEWVNMNKMNLNPKKCSLCTLVLWSACFFHIDMSV